MYNVCPLLYNATLYVAGDNIFMLTNTAKSEVVCVCVNKERISQMKTDCGLSVRLCLFVSASTLTVLKLWKRFMLCGGGGVSIGNCRKGFMSR